MQYLYSSTFSQQRSFWWIHFQILWLDNLVDFLKIGTLGSVKNGGFLFSKAESNSLLEGSCSPKMALHRCWCCLLNGGVFFWFLKSVNFFFLMWEGKHSSFCSEKEVKLIFFVSSLLWRVSSRPWKRLLVYLSKRDEATMLTLKNVCLVILI